MRAKSDHYIDGKYAGYLPPVKSPREHRLGSREFDDYDELLQSLADGSIWCLQMERRYRRLLVPAVLSGDGHAQDQYCCVGHYEFSLLGAEKFFWYDHSETRYLDSLNMQNPTLHFSFSSSMFTACMGSWRRNDKWEMVPPVMLAHSSKIRFLSG